MILYILGTLLGALSLWGALPLLRALSLFWPFKTEYYISQMDDCFVTKPFLNNPILPWLPAGDRVHVWGSDLVEGSAPAGGFVPVLAL